jgi:hypothetical protein
MQINNPILNNYPDLAKVADQINDNGNKRLLLILPESAGDILLATSLFKNLKDLYHEYDIYFACYPQYQTILRNNPYLYKVINYMRIMDNEILMSGTANWPGLFDISIFLSGYTQRFLNYIHNGQTRLGIKLK